ncbi:MAG: hypothetical protein JWM34_3984 [Ilumatobacteraceae bacterium]|nr:hypothetical protein [Ilumatobacteraceae bacterium]
MSTDVVIRVARDDEFDALCAVSVAAFGGDARIGELLGALRESWAWDERLSFVAELDGVIVGQVLYTHALLDAARQLVDVLVLSPIGVRPDLHGRGIGGRLIRHSIEVVSATEAPGALVYSDAFWRHDAVGLRP